jgi:glycosyltransferase involved in cell wall biosynthesis
MNIVFVTSFLDPEHGTGTAERTRRLAIQLAALGCKCSIISMDGKAWLREFSAAQIDVFLTGKLGRRFPVPLPHPINIWRIVRSADVVHIMGYWYFLAALVSLIARLAGKPFALCPAGELAAAFRGAPWKKIYYRLFGRTMIARAASIITITERERQEVMQTEYLPSTRFMISPNGIAPALAPGQHSLVVPTGPFILFLGRLARIKGPDLLIEAFKKIASTWPEVRLILAGPDFGMRMELERRVHSLGLDGRVKFLGFVDEQTRQYLCLTAAFLAVPSRSEVMSMVALEAAALGTPVLLTDRCGFDEIQEVGGGLVVSADTNGLAMGLTKMLGEGGNLPFMGERLQGFVLREYAWPKVAAHLRDHLARLARAA